MSSSIAVSPPLPANEADRVAALHAYSILDTPLEAAFDDITRIAAQVCATPMAAISLIDSERQWFKSKVGVAVRETHRDASICAHAILQQGIFEVPDIAQDPRFDALALATGQHDVRFYASAPLRTPEGHALGSVCVLDTQPRRLSEEQRVILLALARQTMAQLELRKSLADAERLHRHNARIMAVAGHDLKQPLQLMLMALERYQSNSIDPSDLKMAAIGIRAAERLASDLDHLAEASHSEGPQLQPIAVAEVLAHVDQTWRAHAQRRALEFRVTTCDANVETDAGMLATIIGNLVGNAIKYTEAGIVAVEAHTLEDVVRIEVADTGKGIPAERLGTIFEPFKQLDAHSEGLGLGLSIVKRTAEELGCTLHVASAFGCGSRFSIDVPLARG
ncbi:MAG: GAF domain-containing sensor histidine kinase [Dokdonella sp.]